MSTLAEATVVAPPTRPAPRLARRRPAVALGAAAGVLAFWYGATGLLLALERSGATRVLALGVAALAGGAGVACVRAAGRRVGAGAGARAVLGGALLWTCVSAAFYSGWIVGPAAVAARQTAGASLGDAGRAPTIGRALDAVAATAYSSVLAAALLAVAVWAALAAHGSGATRPAAAARYAPATFATLWAAHELAKLNVFVGVASPGAAFLPVYLAHLRRFFGPAHNTPLLACSVVALGAVASLVGWRARRAGADPARRTALALLAGILALAAFEHAMLGVRTPPGWWDAFVVWREAPSRVRPANEG